jgi:hypothetical protein
VRLFGSKRSTPAADEASQPRRRRRAPRPDGPRTIVPLGDARPSWLPDDAPTPSPMALQLDAARDRLRRAIPPVADDADR